ncbi:MAG TPA: uroporphyrinogen decarboxylase family protein [Phycisphaerae bacterium]|nr:uroporphyrinogen decarboxylase family protein [Phycisphaerae bacterium]
MNSRQRLLAAVDHVQPDRVPIAMTYAPEVKRRVMDHLGMDEAQFEAWSGQDMVGVQPTFPNPASKLAYADPTIEVTADGDYLDIWRVPFRPVRAGEQTYMELSGRPPLAGCRSIEELDAFPWPTPGMWDYSAIGADLDARADMATRGHSRGFFEIAHFMRGMDNFLTDLALDPAFACALMDHIIDYLLARSRVMLEAGAGRYALFEYNDDVACQRGLLISPPMWRRHVKPRMAKFCRLAREFGARLLYHCCGSPRAILDDLIEVGVDILNPVQPLAEGMDPFELKRRYGDRITFHGGIDIQQLLPNASAAEVRAHTRRMIEVVGRRGGYILGPSHAVQSDVPTGNILAMIEEARRV